MSIIDVTTGQSYATVSAAITGSAAGDVIDVSAGAYNENFPKIFHDLTIEGVGGLAAFTTPASPVNGQGVLVIDASVTLRNLDISGAAVRDKNGAGIRVETGSLVLQNSHIHNNQDGLLVNAGPGTVDISGSEIDHNGAGDGQSHNLYIGTIARFTLTNSYVHDAHVGHEVKSRAAVTVLTGNRIQDQQGDSSFSVDLPGGGAATVTGNVFEKGLNTQNWIYVHYGGESPPSYTNSNLVLSGNSFINDMPDGNLPYVEANATNSAQDLSGSAAPAIINGNTLYGFATPRAYTDFLGSPVPIVDLYSPADLYSANVSLPLSAAPILDTSSPFAVPEPASMVPLFVVLAAGTLLRRRGRRRFPA